MEQSPSWETNWFPASQEIPPFYGTQSIIAAFTSAYPYPQPIPVDQSKSETPVYIS